MYALLSLQNKSSKIRKFYMRFKTFKSQPICGILNFNYDFFNRFREECFECLLHEIVLFFFFFLFVVEDFILRYLEKCLRVGCNCIFTAKSKRSDGFELKEFQTQVSKHSTKPFYLHHNFTKCLKTKSFLLVNFHFPKLNFQLSESEM